MQKSLHFQFKTHLLTAEYEQTCHKLFSIRVNSFFRAQLHGHLLRFAARFFYCGHFVHALSDVKTYKRIRVHVFKGIAKEHFRSGYYNHI